MTRIALIILCLSTFCFAQTVTHGNHYGSSNYVNKRLLEQPTSGSGVDARKAIGGTVQLPTGELVWDKPVRISSGQKVIGHVAATRIVWLGGPGTSAFEVYANAGNGSVSGPRIEGVQIDCTKGGDAVRVHSSVSSLEFLTIEDVTTTGGIILECEQYSTMIDDTRIYTKGQQAIRIGGGPKNRGGACNVLRRVKVHGFTRGALAVVEHYGALSIEGNSRFEDVHPLNMPADAAQMFYFGGWTDNEGGKHRGNVKVDALFHDEAHKDRPWGTVDGTDFKANNIGGTEKWFWQVNRSGVIRVELPVHNAQTVVSPDSTGKLFVGGQAVALEPVR